MTKLPTSFDNRDALIAHVKQLAPWLANDTHISDMRGGHQYANQQLHAIDAVQYGKTRNYGNGHITKLSPYIHHGVISLNEVRNYVMQQIDDTKAVEKFIQELAWRDFWQRVAEQHQDWLWQDIEPYKTGFMADDYADNLPDDIINGHTGVGVIDGFITDLLHDGYVHNHGRMYLASYIVHFRRIKWQAGAQWFLTHLIDGDEASNNFSWQWVASTFSNKPYIFNLENTQKYFADSKDTSPANNQILNASYDSLSMRLFPNMKG